jgi:hypothetical protein
MARIIGVFIMARDGVSGDDRTTVAHGRVSVGLDYAPRSSKGIVSFRQFSERESIWRALSLDCHRGRNGSRCVQRWRIDPSAISSQRNNKFIGHRTNPGCHRILATQYQGSDNGRHLVNLNKWRFLPQKQAVSRRGNRKRGPANTRCREKIALEGMRAVGGVLKSNHRLEIRHSGPRPESSSVSKRYHRLALT